MYILENISLQPYNTFGIDAKARFFIEIHSMAELQELLKNPAYRQMPKLILGGGSNLLFTQNFDGLLIKISIPGIEKTDENANYVYLKVGAGVVWHDLV